MKTIRAVLVISLLLCSEGFAQRWWYTVARPHRVPLSVYMPYDVLLGYVALDSVWRGPLYWDRVDSCWRTNFEMVKQVRDFLRRQTWNDTLRKIVRCLFAMVDYNPILFSTTLVGLGVPYHPYCSAIAVSLTNYHDDVLRYALIEANRGDHAAYARDMMLFGASYVAHIKIVDTVHIPRRRELIATAEVLDLLKGQVLPPCKPEWTHRPTVSRPQQEGPVLAQSRMWFMADGLERESQRLESSNPCLQFRVVDAPLEGQEDVYSVMFDPDSVFPGREYLAALVVYVESLGCPESVGRDSLCYWVGMHTLSAPMSQDSLQQGFWRRTVTLFPIEHRGTESVVIIPNDDFGLGREVELTRLKAWLRERIAEYRSW